MSGVLGNHRSFMKMTGSGNDFVFFDVRQEPVGNGASRLAEPERVRALCARGTGVGADGMVLVKSSPLPGVDAAIAYFNADGTRATLCGNATLCTVRFLRTDGEGPTPAGQVAIGTDVGVITGRLREGVPEIDLDAVGALTTDMSMEMALEPGAGERRIGFVVVGVPHLVVLVDDVDQVDVAGRGAALRRHPSLGASGANVNFVSQPRVGGRWLVRTFERGVEGETLACGTGIVASASLVAEWGLGASPLSFLTRSGSVLTVRLASGPAGTGPRPSLSGEGRLVFRGTLEDV